MLKLLQAEYKRRWGAPFGKRKCTYGCRKVLDVDEFVGQGRRCIACVKVQQQEYHKKRYAVKLAANGGVPGKRGRKPKSVEN